MKICVCLFRQHGDVLLSSALFRALRKGYPEAHIVAYIYKETFPMLGGHPAIDDFIFYEKRKKSLFYELRKLKEVRQEKFDCIINLTEGDRGAIVSYLSGAKERVGMATHAGRWTDFMWTKMVRPVQKIRHTVERYLDAARVLGIFPEVEERELFFETESVEGLPEEYVHIHPVSRLMFKCWPERRVARLIDLLHERGVQCVLTASPDNKEIEYIDRVLESVKEADPINLSGKLTLKQLGYVIEKSAVLVCVDTVALHMASALKHPMVGLYGPSSEVRWAPWRNNRARVVTKPMSCRPCYNEGCGGSGVSDCLVQISEFEVLAEIDLAYGGVLGERARGSRCEQAPLHNEIASIDN